MNHFTRETLFDVQIDAVTMEKMITAINDKIMAKEPTHILGINADKINELQKNEPLQQVVQKAEIIHADGVSILLAATILNKKIPERIAGIDLMQQLLYLAQEHQYSVYFLGAKEGTINKLKKKLFEIWPNLPIAGIRNGYFSDKEWAEVAQEIKNSEPQLVFVGITSPKKEYLIDYFMNKGINSVFMGVGGSFDVLAGEIKRAPIWVQNRHLEWCFRMLQEPKRLLKRYMVGNIKFLQLTAKEKIKSINKK
ncbi:WecB/TagA/CpsF family glycosyltransferase [Enterococcus hirae]|uniref:WecB/TagA/CpsF family glycosyltransferase n=1 Tax=Enterococcus hirae TaxID=1354 RepID=UPI0015993EF9|nr:WecB/TagA/CpsF family glycosyltransferase [Enterococcus hirae]QKX65284.1 WecB/TagA/CpsF family glycosyltransferase [Enterococcus hirae]